jgi:hypothetical protein
MAINTRLAVVITGNPLDGFTCYGPFHNEPSAHDWAENRQPDDGGWWVMPLEHPKPERTKRKP